MAIYISEKLKQFRKARDLTQEQIADAFNVSPQSVSRWETGTTYPDMELLPHLAVFFNITVDELLGADEVRNKKKIDEYAHNIQTLLGVGKIDEAVELARTAVKEYPLVSHGLYYILLRALGAACLDKTPEAKENIEEYKNEIISIGERIINNEPNNWGIKTQLIEQYSQLGMKNEAKKILHTLPGEIWDTQEIWAGKVLEGEEWIENQQGRIRRFAFLLTDFIKDYADGADLDIQKIIEWRKAVLQINNLISAIYDDESDLITISSDRAWDNIAVAELYCEAGDIENALNYVEKATQDAIYYCNNMDKKAFHGYEINTTQQNLCWILWEDTLMQSKFDIIRDNKRFIKCIDELKVNSRELK